MKTRTEVYKERTEKERNRFSTFASVALMGMLFMIYGYSSLVEDIKSNVSCTGKIGCLIFDIGSLFLVVLGSVFIYFLIFLFIYSSSKYRLEKETTK